MNNQAVSATTQVKTFLKKWMSLVGIALLIIVFSILSYVKFGAQYFLTWQNWKTILLQTADRKSTRLNSSHAR